MFAVLREHFRRKVKPEEFQQALTEAKQVGEVLELPDKWRGLGDVIAAATSAMGMKPCGGCKERQEKLNQSFPL